MSAITIISIAVVAAIVFIIICFVTATLATRVSGITDAAARATFRDSYTKTVAQVLGGAAVVLAFAWTVIKDSQSLERDSITLKQSAVQSANQQFIDAAKLMADSSIEARAAGNYAFEKLVLAYPNYYDSVVSTLLAFAWQHRPEHEQFDKGIRPIRVTEDVNAAVYVIGKLPLQWERLYVRDYYLVGASFSGLPSFRGAEFLGATLFAANFTWADLTSAKFNGARLEDWVSYGWQNNSWDKRMVGTRGDPNEAWWTWERYRYIANFDNAILIGADFRNTGVTGASFKGANITDAYFSGSDISRADFTNAIGSAKFEGACYGRDDPGRPPTKPIGLPDTTMRLLKTCKPAAS